MAPIAGFGWLESDFSPPSLPSSPLRWRWPAILPIATSASDSATCLPPLAIALVPVWLVLKEPDLGTSLVFVPVLFAMLFAAGARRRHLVALALVGVVGIAGAVDSDEP